MAAVDGPTEVHKITTAKQVLRDHSAAPGEWPTQFLPHRRAWARQVLDERMAELRTAELTVEPG
jgi:acyl-CoA dehydrogenase